MAPLYKRYTPAKPPPAPPTVAQASVPTPEPSSARDDAAKKWKRERSEEEIAERKAKKLRKKGNDPATVEHVGASKSNVKENGSAQEHKVYNESASSATVPLQSEFAQVKNVKKRHRLEKEARRARRVALKEDKTADSTGGNTARFHAEHRQAPPEPPSTIPQSPLADDRATGTKEGKKRPKQSSQNSTGEEAILKRVGATPNGPENGQTKRESQRLVETESTESEIDNANITAMPKTGLDGPVSQPKKRRHKLEAILMGAQNGAPQQPNDPGDHLRKHTGIMGRFSHSKAQSENAPKSTTEHGPQTSAPPVVLDLAPLPQPDKAETPEFRSDPSSIPKWLAEPTIIASNDRKGFKDLSLESKVVKQLSNLGFEDAMPVQQALIPLLLPTGTAGAKFMPGTESILPDVAVGAPTGSGKTIAYLLPMLEAVKHTSNLGRLKALVVVPTRELVMQVAAVADSLARGSGIKIGMATGIGSLKDEQSKLIKCNRKYDPDGHRRLMVKAHQRNYPPPEDSEDFREYLDEFEKQDAREERRIQDATSTLVDHVPVYESAIDVLIATPGRLLEHLDSTLGFSLTFLEWLVLDEADKLIDQQYDGFLPAVNVEISRPRRDDEQDSREQYLRTHRAWNERKERRIRKVVLSATMTRDISKLMELKLERPQMILVQSEGKTSRIATPSDAVQLHNKGSQGISHEFELPQTLLEHCVPVGDGSEKPLYFVEVIDKRIFGLMGNARLIESSGTADNQDLDFSNSASSSSSSTSSTSADTVSSADSSAPEDGEDEPTQSRRLDDHLLNSQDASVETAVHPDRLNLVEWFSSRQRVAPKIPVILVFVSSTESAHRLAHLIEILKPEWTSFIHTLTRTDSKKAFSNIRNADPVIVISTDRAARGLDGFANRIITHVVQYDVPRSTTSYVHRVGRTARAGRHGEAWTLYVHSEARWFFQEICKSESIKRAEAVEKVKIAVPDKLQRENLARAVTEIRDAVYSYDSKKSK